MAVSVTMPQLGESVSEGTITRWLKQEGDRVEADEPLLEVSTDKVDTEIPAPTSGILRSIRVAEDETVEIGAELAVIDEGGEAGAEVQAQEQQPDQPSAQEPQAPQQAAPEPTPEPEGVREEPAAPAAEEARPQPTAQPEPPTVEQPAQQPAVAQVQEQQAQPQPAAPPPSAPTGEEDGEAAYVTPLVRKLAAEHGVDLGRLEGSGVGGRIRKQDVLDAARAGGAAAPAPAAPRPAAPAAAPQPAAPAPAQAPRPAAAVAQPRGRTEKLSRLRSVIAQRMTESLQTSAQLTTVVEVDVTRIARLIEQAGADFEAREGVRLRFLPFFAVATCEALKAHPNVNASIDLAQGTVTYHDAVHLGIAVDTERGLLVPVIHDAGDLNLGGLARKIVDLAQRTRDNRVNPDELNGGTFTLTNTGSRGALFDTPIINQPQVGILGTGAVVKRPVVVDDPNLGETIAVRHMMYLALTYDHRLVDGADAARFLGTVKERLEEGEFAADLGL